MQIIMNGCRLACIVYVGFVDYSGHVYTVMSAVGHIYPCVRPSVILVCSRGLFIYKPQATTVFQLFLVITFKSDYFFYEKFSVPFSACFNSILFVVCNWTVILMEISFLVS